jgi:hypothetical protein
MFESDSLNFIDITLNNMEIISLFSNKHNEISKINHKQLKLNFDLTKIFFQNQQHKL